MQAPALAYMKQGDTVRLEDVRPDGSWAFVSGVFQDARVDTHNGGWTQLHNPISGKLLEFDQKIGK